MHPHAFSVPPADPAGNRAGTAFEVGVFRTQGRRPHGGVWVSQTKYALVTYSWIIRCVLKNEPLRLTQWSIICVKRSGSR
jgi:hypothetical protein